MSEAGPHLKHLLFFSECFFCSSFFTSDETHLLQKLHVKSLAFTFFLHVNINDFYGFLPLSIREVSWILLEAKPQAPPGRAKATQPLGGNMEFFGAQEYNWPKPHVRICAFS